MRKLKLYDAPGRALLLRVAGCCGSLACDPQVWEIMEHVLERHRPPAVLEAKAADVFGSAVPVPGVPHPQPAILMQVTDTSVWWRTPGGVDVTLEREGRALVLTVEFNRDSNVLAADMLGRVALAAGCPKHPIWVDEVLMEAGRALAIACLHLVGDDYSAAILADQAQGV